jgi:hypothetical protein
MKDRRLCVSKPIKPILVTGSHRSGSTWAGKTLALAPHTGYIREPFNIGIPVGPLGNPFTNWFQYICEENVDPFRERLSGMVHYRYPLGRNLATMKTVKEFAKIAIDQGLFWLHKTQKHTPIVKDPIALFSAEWLSKAFEMNVLVMIRHPAAFCSSLKIKNWSFDFRNFLNQPLLMKRYLGGFEREIQECATQGADIIDQGILLWNCIHHTISTYQQQHPEWLFVRHEDVSTNPEEQFHSIYKTFNLEFTAQARAAILKQTAEKNPSEQQPGREFFRNSKANITNWKKRLNSREIERIREKTHKISGNFYNDYDW